MDTEPQLAVSRVFDFEKLAATLLHVQAIAHDVEV